MCDLKQTSHEVYTLGEQTDDSTMAVTELRPTTRSREDRRLSALTYVTCALVICLLPMGVVLFNQRLEIHDLKHSFRTLESHMNVLYQLNGLDIAKVLDPSGGGYTDYHPDHPRPSRGGDIGRHTDTHAEDDEVDNEIRADDVDTDDVDPLSRARRSTDNETDTSRRNKKCRKNKQCPIQALHLYASKSVVMEGMGDTDHDKYISGDDVTVAAGEISKHSGFRPAAGPLKIWDNERWPASRYETFADLRKIHRDGTVKITRAGLYLIYVQVTFQTAALHQSVSLYKTPRGETKAVLASCMVSERFETSDITERDSSSIYLLCPITTTHYLMDNTWLHLESTYEGRRIMLNKFLTYWGIVFLN